MYVEYEDRVDVFFGDTTRIEPDDVESLHEKYNKIIGINREHRGNIIRMLFTIANSPEHSTQFLKTLQDGKTI